MGKYGNWEIVGPPLGSGGQSTVYQARSPERVSQRASCLKDIRRALDEDRRDVLATSILSYARRDLPDELGALKVFKIRRGGAPAGERLKREIDVLKEGRPGLPKLVDSNAAGQWMVTEYFPRGTLEKSPSKYKGDPASALKAFRTLVRTVATSLHKDNIVHRDIKPANVFIGSDDALVPGDFGIVYLADQAARPTVTDERVGPWDYMPQWADLGVRFEDVRPNFDVYMLGKLLWCMIAGRLRLPREYHRRPDFDLTILFPKNRHMPGINTILDKCLVEEPDDCLASAGELLELVEESLANIERDGLLPDGDGQLTLYCRVCGRGTYQEHATVRFEIQDAMGRKVSSMPVRVLVCNVCANYEFFAPNFPDEASSKGWKPWISKRG